VFKLAERFGKTTENELRAEMSKKGSITLANQALDDVKVFFSSMLTVMQIIYGSSLPRDDYDEMKEDIAKLIINLILKDDVLKVLVCLVRIDTFESDKDLRTKYTMLKGVQTTDFGIDPYLSLNDPQIFFKELFLKHGIQQNNEAADAISTS
jgi:hypothetical protein